MEAEQHVKVGGEEEGAEKIEIKPLWWHEGGCSELA